MKYVKKSFNLPERLANELEALVRANPGSSLTFIVVQALESWLANPQVRLSRPATDDVGSSSTKKKASSAPPTKGRESIEAGN